MIKLKSLLPKLLTKQVNSVRLRGMIMEGTKAKNVEAFLKSTIKGTEWDGKVYAVGGFVRDEIMGMVPKDIDVVVDKPQGGVHFTIWLAKKIGNYKGPTTPPPVLPPDVRVEPSGRLFSDDPEGKSLAQYLNARTEYYAQMSNPVVFPKFGTAKMVLDGATHNGVDLTGEDLEAVMPRSEQYHDPNTRKPTEVEYSTLKGDSERRDLTINSIYKNVSTGEILDPVGGIADIKAKIIRTAVNPDLIYRDDALRMFRVIRFANRFGWELTPEVKEGIKRNLHRLHNTSRERIRDELNYILRSDTPDRGIRLLRDTGLLPYIAKELHQTVGMTQNKWHKHDVFEHTLEVLKQTQPDLVTRLMALFHDIGKVVTRSETPTGVHFYGHENEGPAIAERIMRNLKYPNDLIDAVKLGVGSHMALKHGKDEAKIKDSTLRKFKINMGDQLERVLDLVHADNISHADASAMPNQIDLVRKRLEGLNIQVKKPNLPINGNDLMALGLKPGPMFAKILGAVTDVWFSNPNVSKEEALAIAKQIAGL